MGKGDRRTRRGKIYNGSFGKKRPNKLSKLKQAAAQARSPVTAASRARTR